MSDRKKIVVMDDSALVLDATTIALEQNGFAVVAVENLSALEAACARSTPDLFVLDVQMPEIFGDDVGQVLREVRKMKVPIILFSSMPESDLVERTREAALDGCVSKSDGLDALVKCIASLIGPGQA
jgi:DNA-binding response OmpR family regulator